jgi:uncharacterized protein YxjI
MEEFFGGRTRFIITSNLEDCKDSGSIMDADGKIIAYFEHTHSWKTRNGPKWWRNKKEARTTDIRVVGIDKTLLGEIHEIPPPMMSRIIRKWEINNSKKEHEGIVREKLEFIGSSWVLENLEGKVIATVKGNRRKKDYKIIRNRGETIARCYRSEKIGKKSYYADIKRSEIDLFLVLGYIIVLDLAKTGWTTRSGGLNSVSPQEAKTKIKSGWISVIFGFVIFTSGIVLLTDLISWYKSVFVIESIFMFGGFFIITGLIQVIRYKKKIGA